MPVLLYKCALPVIDILVHHCQHYITVAASMAFRSDRVALRRASRPKNIP